MFWDKKKQLESEEYRKLIGEIAILHAKISALSAEIIKLDDLFNSLRGLVNRKLNYSSEEKQKETETDKNINSDYIPFG